MVRNITIIVIALTVGIAVGAAALFSVVYEPYIDIEVSKTTTIEISLAQFGGFVPPDLARQEIHVFDDGTVIVLWKSQGEITNDYTQRISRANLEDLARRIIRNGFYKLDARYTTPEGVVVADAGVAELTVRIDGLEKTVVIDPNIDDYLPPNLREILQEIRSVSQDTVEQGSSIDPSDLCRYVECSDTGPEIESALDLAKQFIVYAPTFKFDGIKSTIRVANVRTLESFPPRYVVTITFESRHAGYGDRAGEMLAQVITPHTAVVTITEGRVVSAFLDGQWDEMRQEATKAEEQPGTVTGRVTIGPLCPVEPCPEPKPDVYSSREIILQPETGEPIRVGLNPDGSFEALVKPGRYTVDLTDCGFLGCAAELPKTVTVESGEIIDVRIDIDTGIR